MCQTFDGRVLLHLLVNVFFLIFLGICLSAVAALKFDYRNYVLAGKMTTNTSANQRAHTSAVKARRNLRDFKYRLNNENMSISHFQGMRGPITVHAASII